MTSPLPCAACLSQAEVYVEADTEPVRSYVCRSCAAIYDPAGEAGWNPLPHPSSRVVEELRSLEHLSGRCGSTAKLLEVEVRIVKPRACAGCGRMLMRGDRATVVTGGAGSARASRTFCVPCHRGDYANLPEDPVVLARVMLRRLASARDEPCPF